MTSTLKQAADATVHRIGDLVDEARTLVDKPHNRRRRGKALWFALAAVVAMSALAAMLRTKRSSVDPAEEMAHSTRRPAPAGMSEVAA